MTLHRQPTYLDVLVSLEQGEKSNPAPLWHPREDNTIDAPFIVFLAPLPSGLCVVVLVADDTPTIEHVGVCTPQQQEVDKFLRGNSG